MPLYMPFLTKLFYGFEKCTLSAVLLLNTDRSVVHQLAVKLGDNTYRCSPRGALFSFRGSFHGFA